MLRLSAIDNLSGSGYRLRAPDCHHSLLFETPARIHERVVAHQCEAALLPVASLPAVSNYFDVIGAYGIACRGPVRSVQLFSSSPLGSLLRQGLPIYATPKSRSSIALLRILCARRFGVAPKLTCSYPGAAAHLLIGDGAFEYAQRNRDTQHDIDLSGWWFEEMGLPFVFARWVVSKSLPQHQRDVLSDWLDASIQYAASPEGFDALVNSEDEGTEREFRHTYFTNLRYNLTAEDLSGMDRFLQLMEGNRYDRTARSA